MRENDQSLKLVEWKVTRSNLPLMNHQIKNIVSVEEQVEIQID
jgi:hypothetical protein